MNTELLKRRRVKEREREAIQNIAAMNHTKRDWKVGRSMVWKTKY
jgi:hypothetical protein